jgi:NAD(P)H-hydrate repair Nnr-like enzyme with NAD(P)H-hydrate dehydratase domain
VLIAKQDGNFWVNSYVNSGMATGGSGDVLTGLISGFLAQKTSPVGAAVGGVFIHSQAGEILKEQLGEHSMIAGDLIDAIPQAILDTIEG